MWGFEFELLLCLSQKQRLKNKSVNKKNVYLIFF